MSDRNVTPVVRITAERLGVNLDNVTGTGAGGRVTLRDVHNAAPAAARPAAPASRPGRPVPPVATNPYFARNPVVDAAKAEDPSLVAKAARKAPAPTLFDSGDLPPFTASGVDPQLLLHVPWQARHAVAEARTQEEAHRLLYRYGTEGGGGLVMMDNLDFSAPNQRYRNRVKEWLNNGFGAQA